MPQLGLLALVSLASTVASVAYSVTSGLKARADAKQARREAQDRASRRNYRAPVPPRRIVYGTRNLGGPFLYLDNIDTNVLLVFVELASHEVEDIQSIYLNEERIFVPREGGIAHEVIEYTLERPGESRTITEAEWLTYPWRGGFTARGQDWDGKGYRLGDKFDDRMEIYRFLGEPGQNVGAKLTELGATNITESDRFEGIAGLVIRTDNLSREIPDVSPNWNAEVLGKKVKRRDGTIGWSDNVAECGRDFLESYVPSDLVPVINIPSWTQAAEDCAEIVTRKDGSEVPRYSLNGIIISDEQTRDSLDQIQLAMAGHISSAGGEWYFEAGKWKGEEVEYPDGSILGEVEISLQGRASEIPTHVKGVITSADHNWSEVEYPVQVLDPNATTRVDTDLPMEMVTSHEQAQRIAQIEGRRARQEFGLVVTLGPIGLQSRPGTVGRYTIPMMESLGSQLYELIDFDRELGQDEGGTFYRTSHSLRSTSESDFFWDAETMEQDLLTGTNSLSSNNGCTPSFVRFTRIDTDSIPSQSDDPTTPSIDESENGEEGSTEIEITWTEPSCAGRLIEFTRIRGILDGIEMIEDIPAGVGTATLKWAPENSAPITVSAKAFFDDGTNTGETLGAPG